MNTAQVKFAFFDLIPILSMIRSLLVRFPLKKVVENGHALLFIYY